MRGVVRERWLEFTEKLEGGIPYLYADIIGLVTCAYGNLVDPMSHALGLPWRHPGGVPASTSEIASAWQAVKNDRDAARYGHRYAASLTRIRLTREGMADLALGKLAANDAILARRLDGWDEMPACAQMAMHSLAWACGPAANFPKLFSALDAGDYDAAAVHIHINEWSGTVHNRGLIPRNRAQKILMRNAARVVAYRLDPDLLEWEEELAVGEAVTVPALTDPPSEPTVHVDPSVYLGNGEPDDNA